MSEFRFVISISVSIIFGFFLGVLKASSIFDKNRAFLNNQLIEAGVAYYHPETGEITLKEAQ